MKNALLAVWNFYLEGFRSMTLGRTLWVIILLKLFVMFFILKLFFFPNFLSDHPTEAEKNHLTVKFNDTSITFAANIICTYLRYQ